MNDKENRRSPLEDGLLVAMRAIDRQIEREMQRTPEQEFQHGVLKWEPYAKRVELVTAYILKSLGNREAHLDSTLVLAQAFAKALRLFIDDLGQEGLGQVRASYCRDAVHSIAQDLRRAETSLGGEENPIS